MSSAAPTLVRPAEPVAELAENQAMETLPAPTRQHLIDRAIRETRCTADQAASWYRELLTAARARDGVHHLSQAALNFMHDDVLTKVMPDDQVAQAGTLHADANMHFSSVVGRPVRLMHRNADRGTVRDCYVTLENTTKTDA